MVILVILLGLAFGHLPDDIAQQFLKFDQHYYAFKVDLLGCPAGAEHVSDCNLSAGVLNYREFVQMAREARKLFSLEGCK